MVLIKKACFLIFNLLNILLNKQREKMIDIAEWNGLESEYNTPKDIEFYCDDCEAVEKDLCICEG